MATSKKTYWTGNRIKILGILAVAITAITVASIQGWFSKKTSAENPTQEINSPSLDSGTQNNSQIKQTNNNTGDVNNEIVSGTKTTTNNYTKKAEYKINKNPPSEVNTNNGVNNGNIGGNNNTVYNVQKLPQRTIDENLIDQIIAANPRKLNYTIRYYSNNETNAVYLDLRKRLENRGYLVKQWAILSWTSPAKIQKEIEIFSTPGEDSTMGIMIYPQEQ